MYSTEMNSDVQPRMDYFPTSMDQTDFELEDGAFLQSEEAQEEAEAQPDQPDREAPVETADDPVRVYLREMGSIQLLTKKGEVVLARQMERGQGRAHKQISRSPLVQATLVRQAERIGKGLEDVGDIVEIGSSTEENPTAAEKRRVEMRKRFAEVLTLQRQLLQLEAKTADIGSNPKQVQRHNRKLMRAKVRLSRAMRAIPFKAGMWLMYASEIERAFEELSHLDAEVRRLEERGGVHSDAKVRELKREIRRREAIAGATFGQIRRGFGNHQGR